MCELLGMSANVPTDICFSFTGLMQRGGNTGPHKDGWGIVFYHGRGYREFKDPDPGAQSQVAQLVRKYPIKSDIVISHIRQANSGRVAIENTHPFSRELWGRHWSFAHNGQVKAVKKWPLNFYQPIGSTDSEHAFCWLLDQVRARYPKPPASRTELSRCIAGLCAQLQPLGVFNMLLTDSSYLFASADTDLAWITRKAPFGQASLKDADLTIDFCEETTAGDVVTVVATRPLTTDEEWQQLRHGQMIVFQNGKAVKPRGELTGP